MTAAELKTYQKRINLDCITMALLCEVPYNTWKNYYHAVNAIPAALVPKIMDVYYFNLGLVMAIPYEMEARGN